MSLFKYFATTALLFWATVSHAQSPDCLRNRPWPEFYTQRVLSNGVNGPTVEIELHPAIHADVLVIDPRQEGNRLNFDLVLSDSCSGFGPQPLRQVSATFEDVTADEFSVDVNIDEFAFPFLVITYPTRTLPLFRGPNAQPIPALGNPSKFLLVSLVALLAIGCLRFAVPGRDSTRLGP